MMGGSAGGRPVWLSALRPKRSRNSERRASGPAFSWPARSSAAAAGPAGPH